VVSSIFLSFYLLRLISAVADWMSAILAHMVWPYDTLLPYRPARALRFSDQQLLQILYMNTEFGRRSFSYCSPKKWNEIPAIIKASVTVANFKGRLKSHFLSQLPLRNTTRLGPPAGDCARLRFENSSTLCALSIRLLLSRIAVLHT